MTRSGRRRLYLIGAVVLVVALVGGRWLSVETAERAWDQTFPGGAALIEVRRLALLLQALVFVFAVTWMTGNLLFVYRAIGSVQMPRRLGDLEIVEAVPQRVLFGTTLLAGLVFGFLFSLGTGDWWRYAVLAAAPPHFGVADPTLHRDAGYFVGVLPWQSALQNRALILAIGAVAIVALLYAIIGSLRIRRARLRASDYARTHCGVLLAGLALVIAWGALLDPAEVVAGMHGVVDQAALSVRIPGAAAVAAIAVVAAGISLVWAWRDRPNLIIAGWTALLLAIIAGYFVIPGVVRASGTPESTALGPQRAVFERIAFGLNDLDENAPPALPSGEVAVRTLPQWDPAHVGLALSAPASAVALRAAAPTESGASWLVANATATAPASPVRLAVESDTGLMVTSLPARDATQRFAPGAQGALVVTAPSDSAANRTAGVPIRGAWRRFAIAWTIQSWGLVREDSQGSQRVLLWRRDVTERLGRLAPFARFGPAAPAIRDGALWWVSWGYVSHDAFPLTRPLPWHHGGEEDPTDVRYLAAGLVGAVRAGTGETHLWLAPGYDSLTATWARRFEPLVERADKLPPELRAQLTYPAELFDVSVAQLLRIGADSAGTEAAWVSRPREPFELSTPAGELWTGIGVESGTLAPRRFVGLCAGAITARGPKLHFWRPSASAGSLSAGDPATVRLPGELVGSSLYRPGQLRIWPTAGSVITVQAQFLEPVGVQRLTPRVAEVWVSLGDRSGRGPTPRAALHGGEEVVTDTTLAARWSRARRLATRADSALNAGDLELFARLWRALMGELAPPQRPH